MDDQPRAYRAVFFDLDGTLLPMDLDEFLGSYFKRLGAFLEARGKDSKTYIDALNAGVRAIIKDDTYRVNSQVFWETFLGAAKDDDAVRQEWAQLFEEFYSTDYRGIENDVVPSDPMVAAVSALRDKGYTLCLTTMPLFPEGAVAERLRWAGLDASWFVRLTHYENSTAPKPSLHYYAENLVATGLRGEDVLMVGNNTVEDLAAMKLGCDAFLVTDHLLDPVDFDMSTVRHGSAEQFLQWVRALPACANPVTNVDTGAIDACRVEEER